MARKPEDRTLTEIGYKLVLVAACNIFYIKPSFPAAVSTRGPFRPVRICNIKSTASEQCWKACALNNRTLIGVFVLVGLFLLGISPLLHTDSGSMPSSPTTPSVILTTLPGNGTLSPITGLEVQYSGVFYSGSILPACSTEPHQCLLPEVVFFFLITNSSAYRLIPISGPILFPEGTRVVVTGILVTPSSSGSMVWQGYTIAGDIYVQSISPA